MTYPTRDDQSVNRIRNLLNIQWYDLDRQREQAEPGSQQEADLLAQQLQLEKEMAAL